MKQKTIRARNTLDAERLREYVRFFFRLNYNFLGTFAKSMAFLLLLISLAALYTMEWLIFAYIIITAIILGGFSVFVKILPIFCGLFVFLAERKGENCFLGEGMVFITEQVIHPLRFQKNVNKEGFCC